MNKDRSEPRRPLGYPMSETRNDVGGQHSHWFSYSGVYDWEAYYATPRK